ncbi:hypothetical protein INT47_010253 [Mucor saturninus]|uniref:Uncharacterized protein n=1 Tax=Mucor saturninus TaxID=64648 RepID=A0A8H7RE32_9FUNG|nr:hypothetical protein INT47_010253 [Mucor saturninus]
MSSHRQRLANLNLTETREKQKRLEGGVTTTEIAIVAAVLEAGHKDTRSRLCPLNKNYDPTGMAPMSKCTGRSNTATIRNVLDKHLALASQAADKAARASGKKNRQKKTSNPVPVKPCPYCVCQYCYNANEPHASRASKKCPGYIPNKIDFIEQELGKNFQRFMIKTGLDASLLIAQPAKVSVVCILLCTPLSVGRDSPAPNFVYSGFFYACIQKIIGKDISNTNLPRAHLNTVILRFNIAFPGCYVEDSINANTLAAMANSSEACFRNNLNHYIFQHFVNASTGLTWPKAVSNTLETQRNATSIIEACRVNNAPATMSYMSGNPEIFL